MMAKYSAPPYQPKWILQTQVFLLRHFKGPLTKNLMILTTTGRKTGHKHSIPINYVQDGETYLVLNLGKHSHWFLNARSNPGVTVEVDGRTIEARATEVPVNTPQQIKAILEVYERARPQMLDSFFGMKPDASPEQLLTIGTRVGFMRFTPLHAEGA